MKYYLSHSYLLVATFSIIVPIIVGFIRFKNLDRLIKSLVLFLVLELINEIIAFSLGLMGHTNGFEYACYYILETCYFSAFFYIILQNKWIQRMIFVIIPAFVILGIFELAFSAVKTVWYTPITVTESTLIVILSIVYYYRLMNASVYIKLSQDPDFWVVTGILTYAVLSFFPFGFYNFLHKYHLEQISHIDVHIIAISNLIMYSFFTLAFLCPRKSRILN
jgi:hypothetical protein